ncbi:glycoside hydrolase family 75 protein [Streptomyces sp. NPDC058001]|uniref:glycoside hydrolase family 75 protein n=1 Tax=Streptomyces sp. NPDC058001 TaxID=3346300 RepID=UPI0036E757D3
MRNRTVALAATIGTVLLAPTPLADAQSRLPLPTDAALREEAAPAAPAAPAPAQAGPAAAPAGPAAVQEGSVSAADLLAAVRGCTPVSRGRYRTDEGTRPTIPVCGRRGAVYWKADMDIDCDGRPGRNCNRRADPLFSRMTAFQQSDGKYLSPDRLPYIVVPGRSRVWNHEAHGVRGGSVAAVLYRGRLTYAVVGDTGPTGIIGEASYATAKALGIPAHPRMGGAASGVTYIVFKNSKVTPIQSHRAAVAEGERLAREFVRRK